MPTILHGIVQFVLAMLLEKAGWNASLEVRLKVVPDAEPVPDIVAVQGKFRETHPTVAPQLCVEILSPGDTLPKALDKAKRYVAWGSSCVWVVDPEKRTAWLISKQQTQPNWIPRDGELRIRDTAVWLELLFSKVDRKLETAQEQ